MVVKLKEEDRLCTVRALLKFVIDHQKEDNKEQIETTLWSALTSAELAWKQRKETAQKESEAMELKLKQSRKANRWTRTWRNFLS
jgi:hypothetical protein